MILLYKIINIFSLYNFFNIDIKWLFYAIITSCIICIFFKYYNENSTFLKLEWLLALMVGNGMVYL